MARRLRVPVRQPKLLLLRLTMVVAAAVGLAAHAADAVHVEIINHCEGLMKLYDGANVTRLKQNASEAFDLPPTSIRAYRYDTITQATLAEFSIDVDNKTWYDISIIPTGPLGGPELCASLEACKAHTGGVGFNKPMLINPRVNYPDENCRKLVCLEDGCDDAYQFPQQDEKTHCCPAGVDFQVIFCPSPQDVELDWFDVNSALESGVVVGDTVAPATQAPTPPPDEEVMTRSVSENSSSAAAYVASALGGTVVLIVIVGSIVRYRRRVVADVQYHWPDRKSSDAISFVSARDVI